MILLQWEESTEDEKQFVNNLILASVLDIARTEDFDRFIEEGIFTYCNDVYTVYKNAMRMFTHSCNDACLVRNSNGTF